MHSKIELDECVAAGSRWWWWWWQRYGYNPYIYGQQHHIQMHCIQHAICFKHKHNAQQEWSIAYCNDTNNTKQPEEKSHPRTENTIDNSATVSVIAVRKSRFSETKLEFYQWILMNILRWRYGDVCVLYYNSFLFSSVASHFRMGGKVMVNIEI